MGDGRTDGKVRNKQWNDRPSSTVSAVAVKGRTAQLKGRDGERGSARSCLQETHLKYKDRFEVKDGRDVPHQHQSEESRVTS